MQRVFLSCHLHRQFGFRQTQCFPGVELAEVDGLGDVSIRLSPVLADLKHQPCGKFKLAPAQHIAYPEHQARAFLNRGPLPMLESFQRRLHRRLNMFLPGLLMNSYNLARIRRVDRSNLLRRF